MANSAILREHIAQVNTLLNAPRDNSAQESVKVLGQRVTKVVCFLYMCFCNEILVTRKIYDLCRD